MRRICVMGTGYVGLVTGACLSDFGNAIVCLDIDEERIDRLKNGELPIYAPGLEELVPRNTERGRLSFSALSSTAVSARRVMRCLARSMGPTCMRFGTNGG